MRRAVRTRLLLLVPVLLLVSIGSFLLVELVPGDPALQVLGPNGTPQDYAQIRQQMGLDRPVATRYLHWLGDVLHGDLGRNLVPPSTEVLDRIRLALPVNLELAVLALGMALVLAVPAAMISAYRPGSRFDRWTSTAMFAMISVPSFLMAILLVLAFSVHWHLFPIGQWARPTDQGWAANLHHAFLPAFTLALAEVAVFTRLLRNDMIETLQQDFILAARAKGMPTWHVLLREALRPSSFSVVTLAGVSFGRLLGGTIVVEAVFALPGVGSTIVDGARVSDYTLVQGGVLVIAVTYILINLAVDLLYAAIDPRVRRSHG